MGFGVAHEGPGTAYDRMREKLLEESKKFFRPEFLNRLDDVIVFRSLTRDDLIRILDLEVAKVVERVRRRNLRIVLDAPAKDFLVDKGYDPQYGARPMRRAVEKHLEDPLAEELLRGTLADGEEIQVTVEAGKLVFRQPSAAAPEVSAGVPAA
jgi:ATP-dependent Clp protease ATP-binding subunit ClpC